MATGEWLEHMRIVSRAHREKDVAVLVAALADPDVRIRLDAAGFLGELRERSAVEPLVELLRDPDAVVRVQAVRALERIGDRRAGTPLADVANDERERSWIRMASARALLELRDPASVDAVGRLLHAPERWNRNWAVRTLVELGDRRAIPALENAVATAGFLQRRRLRRAIRELARGRPRRAG